MINGGTTFQSPVQCKERACAEGAPAPTYVTELRVGHFISSKLWIFRESREIKIASVILLVTHYTTPYRSCSSQQQQQQTTGGHSIASCLIGFWLGGISKGGV